MITSDVAAKGLLDGLKRGELMITTDIIGYSGIIQSHEN